MDSRVTELHCIMPMVNINSVMEHGILSHERASNLKHHSVAQQPVQDKRDQKQVPGGLKLHQYANLYFHARNPMLFKRLNEAATLCVLQVANGVLQINGTVITDQNAASDYVRFLGPAQWEELAFDDIFALDWRHPDDQVAFWRHRARKCAEVLVPHRVDVKFLTGAYVIDANAKARLGGLGFSLPVTVDPLLFFR
jgi:hypothetical protein